MDKEKKITVLDGGLGTELRKKGHNLNDPLWSARLLHTDPSAIVDVHKSYIAHGSDIITASSYQASIEGFQKYLGATVEESKNLIKKSIDLARQAKSDCLKNSIGNNVQIAGSVGPYGAVLADGSEYSGDYCDRMSHEELIAWHKLRFQLLVEAGVDLIAIETIPAVKEGEALMKLLHDFPNTKAWLSFSCQSADKTVHREDIGTVAKRCLKIAPSNQLIAIGVNCCPPEHVRSLLIEIRKEACEFPLITYPNSGEKWISQVGWEGNKNCFRNYINDYIDLANFVGGCCRTGPEDIAEIVKKIKL